MINRKNILIALLAVTAPLWALPLFLWTVAEIIYEDLIECRKRMWRNKCEKEKYREEKE